jgi:hypothetical protein
VRGRGGVVRERREEQAFGVARCTAAVSAISLSTNLKISKTRHGWTHSDEGCCA